MLNRLLRLPSMGTAANYLKMLRLFPAYHSGKSLKANLSGSGCLIMITRKYCMGRKPIRVGSVLTAASWMLALLCISCGPADYRRFLQESPKYYAKLASECDSLLARGPVTGSPATRLFAQQSDSLPPGIRDLKPTHIEIAESSVLLSVGSYFIIWHESDQNHGLWVMVAYQEGHSRQVYSRKKPL